MKVFSISYHASQSSPIMDYFAFMEYVVLELFEHALLLTFEATYLLSYSRTQSFKNYQNLFELLV